MILIDKKIDRRIFALALPAIGEMMSHTLVWAADTAMIGRLTAADIAGVNLGVQIMFTLCNIMGAVGIGATALVARNIGAKDTERAEYIAGLALSIGIIVAVLLGSLGIVFAESIFTFIVDDPNVIRIGTSYTKIVFLGAFFVIPMIISSSIIRATGNTVVPMVAAIATNAVNIIGDYVLIFGKFGFPALEANGAAIATGGSQAIGFIICIVYLIKGKSGIKLRKKNMFNFKKETLKTLINLSTPAGMETFMNEGSRLLSSFWIAQLGTIAFAANSLAVAAESLSFMPGNGFAVAAASLVGQNLGAGKHDLAEKVAKRSVFYAAFFMGLVGLAFFLFPYSIMSFFSTDKGSVLEASKAIRIGAFEQIPIAVAMVMSGALKGAGDTKGPFRISLITNIVFRLPLIFAIVFLIKGSISHVWAATAVQYTVEAVLMVIRYRRGYWRRIDIR